MSEANDPSERRDEGSERTLIVWLGCGILVVLGVALVPQFFSGRMLEANRRSTCMQHLDRLGAIYRPRAESNIRSATEYSGSALWLSYRQEAKDIKRGDEYALICPADRNVVLPETEAEKVNWDRVDLEHAPRTLCSYAGRSFRDFPLDVDGAVTRQPIGACLNHEGFAIVLFAAGDLQRLTLAELGLASDDEKIVGPTSKSPLLRVLTYGDGSVR